MPVLVSRVEDLDDGQMATIKSIWETIKQLAPRSARKTYNAYTDDDFTEFVTSIFQDDWNTSRRPIQAAWKPKKQDMNAITVGVWNKDVVKKADGATTIPAGKRKGAEALCRPEVVGDTVVFKIVDKHGAMHTFKDVTWDNGDRLTGETKARVCMHYDRNEFSHVMAFNLQAARTHIQHYLWTPNDRMAVRAADPLPEFKETNLCLPLWRSMYQDARVVRKEMKKMSQRRNYL
ncbi:hypothetical protein PFICI_05445 [Pestalotiopsis fici W106-1]|uniref:Uncharacterized protein n=1 Tax=Pestalotiopsis fici (strain W106-1 / CGMCC3.15140) TaxID=1229662 RepID=W3XC18_PESFW|nr:uncharacterized protein PFICI_05445 [Pestalotiopsis fici W106-1]ETS83569.1 hypothetical protein PFICI_05445 [Pestalotiopsis fici W106-1]